MFSNEILYLLNHTITQNDQAMYENFIVKHPDGNIARKEFRLIFLFHQLQKRAHLCR